MEDSGVVRPSKLEEVLAAVIENKCGQRREVTYPSARNFKSDIENP